MHKFNIKPKIIKPPKTSDNVSRQISPAAENEQNESDETKEEQEEKTSETKEADMNFTQNQTSVFVEDHSKSANKKSKQDEGDVLSGKPSTTKYKSKIDIILSSNPASKKPNKVVKVEGPSNASQSSNIGVAKNPLSRLASSILKSLQIRNGSKHASVVLESKRISKQDNRSKIGLERARIIFGSDKDSIQTIASKSAEFTRSISNSHIHENETESTLASKHSPRKERVNDNLRHVAGKNSYTKKSFPASRVSSILPGENIGFKKISKQHERLVSSKHEIEKVFSDDIKPILDSKQISKNNSTLLPKHFKRSNSGRADASSKFGSTTDLGVRFVNNSSRDRSKMNEPRKSSRKASRALGSVGGGMIDREAYDKRLSSEENILYQSIARDVSDRIFEIVQGDRYKQVKLTREESVDSDQDFINDYENDIEYETIGTMGLKRGSKTASAVYGSDEDEKETGNDSVSGSSLKIDKMNLEYKKLYVDDKKLILDEPVMEFIPRSEIDSRQRSREASNTYMGLENEIENELENESDNTENENETKVEEEEQQQQGEEEEKEQEQEEQEQEEQEQEEQQQQQQQQVEKEQEQEQEQEVEGITNENGDRPSYNSSKQSVQKQTSSGRFDESSKNYSSIGTALNTQSQSKRNSLELTTTRDTKNQFNTTASQTLGKVIYYAEGDRSSVVGSYDTSKQRIQKLHPQFGAPSGELENDKKQSVYLYMKQHRDNRMSKLKSKISSNHPVAFESEYHHGGRDSEDTISSSDSDYSNVGAQNQFNTFITARKGSWQSEHGTPMSISRRSLLKIASNAVSGQFKPEEIRSEQHETRDQQQIRRSEQHETRDQQQIRRSEQHETRDQQQIRRSEQHETRDQQPIARSEQYETRDQQPIARSEQYATRDQDPEPRAWQNETRDQQQIPRSVQYETRGQEPISQSMQYETRGQEPIKRPGQYETRYHEPIPQSEQYETRGQEPIPQSGQYETWGQEPKPRSEQYITRGKESTSRLKQYEQVGNEQGDMSGTQGHKSKPRSRQFETRGQESIPRLLQYETALKDSKPMSKPPAVYELKPLSGKSETGRRLSGETTGSSQKSHGGWSGSGSSETNRVFMKSGEGKGYASVDFQLYEKLEESIARSSHTYDGSGCTICHTANDDIKSVAAIYKSLHEAPHIWEAGLPQILGDLIFNVET